MLSNNYSRRTVLDYVVILDTNLLYRVSSSEVSFGIIETEFWVYSRSFAQACFDANLACSSAVGAAAALEMQVAGGLTFVHDQLHHHQPTRRWDATNQNSDMK